MLNCSIPKYLYRLLIVDTSFEGIIEGDEMRYFILSYKLPCVTKKVYKLVLVNNIYQVLKEHLLFTVNVLHSLIMT